MADGRTSGRERLLHVAGDGGDPPDESPASAEARAGWTQYRHALPAVRRRGDAELPLARLLRLSLFQVSVGMAVVLLIGTLNRVMIVELGVPAWLVAVMVSLPLVFAPFRAVIGFRSDTHRSVLGWRRVPYIWMGTLIQFGGLAIMPFALIVLSGDTHGPLIDRPGRRRRSPSCWSAPDCTRRRRSALRWPPISHRRESHPKVVALHVHDAVARHDRQRAAVRLCCWRHFSEIRLIQVIQGAALATMVLNVAALWKQEPRDPRAHRHEHARPTFAEAWAVSATARHRPAAWWRWASARSPSACRTSCWSRTAVRFCI